MIDCPILKMPGNGEMQCFVMDKNKPLLCDEAGGSRQEASPEFLRQYDRWVASGKMTLRDYCWIGCDAADVEWEIGDFDWEIGDFDDD